MKSYPCVGRSKRADLIKLACAICLAFFLPTAKADENTDARLKKWLAKYPQADTNQDGVLTEEEARTHKKAMSTSKTPVRSEIGSLRTPTHENVAYGTHPRQILDVWQATSTSSTPVLVFFHGGSFKAGDKSNILTRPILEQCLQSGISVVSANYRFSTDAPFPAPMHDGARAVQFIRSKAHPWNLDPDRVAVSGSSAGATLALWIALHDDLVDPKSQDPVATYSSRVTCACPHSGTAGLSSSYFRQHAGATKLGNALLQLFGVKSLEEFESPKLSAAIQEASPLTHVTSDDPPLLLTYAGSPEEAPFAAGAVQRDWIHHVSLGIPLKNRYEELGLPCELYSQANKAAENAEIDFLKKHLLRK